MQRKGAVYRKIRKFFQRDRKAILFKVSKELIEHDPQFISTYIQSKPIDKHPTWVRNVFVQILDHGRDFVNNTKTVRIDYTYPKYGNL